MKFAVAVAVAGLLLASETRADVLYQNSWSSSGANCAFSSTCAQLALGYSPHTFQAAQRFTLSGPANILSASFSEWDAGGSSTNVNWAFYSVSGNLPGAMITGGSSSVSKTAVVGDTQGYTVNDLTFDVSANLVAGDYYFAFSTLSPSFFTYLSAGQASGGAAQSQDSGATWSLGYQGNQSVAIGLYGASLTPAVPEASTWAMMILGFLGVGVMTFRRRAKPFVFQAAEWKV